MSEFSRVYRRALIAANGEGSPRQRLERAADILLAVFPSYGVESISAPNGRELHYLNTGGTYETTLAIEDNGRAFRTSWGDWLESGENEFLLAMGAVRCGYCGETCDHDDDTEDWRDVPCACGHYVDGRAINSPIT